MIFTWAPLSGPGPGPGPGPSGAACVFWACNVAASSRVTKSMRSLVGMRAGLLGMVLVGHSVSCFIVIREQGHRLESVGRRCIHGALDFDQQVMVGDRWRQLDRLGGSFLLRCQLQREQKQQGECRHKSGTKRRALGNLRTGFANACSLVLPEGFRTICLLALQFGEVAQSVLGLFAFALATRTVCEMVLGGEIETDKRAVDQRLVRIGVEIGGHDNSFNWVRTDFKAWSGLDFTSTCWWS